MAYLKFIDGLPRVAKIILSIIPICHLLFVVYLIIKNVVDKVDVVVWVLDIIALVVDIIFYVGNIVWQIIKGETFSLGRIVAGK